MFSFPGYEHLFPEIKNQAVILKCKYPVLGTVTGEKQRYQVFASGLTQWTCWLDVFIFSCSPGSHPASSFWHSVIKLLHYTPLILSSILRTFLTLLLLSSLFPLWGCEPLLSPSFFFSVPAKLRQKNSFFLSACTCFFCNSVYLISICN